MFCRLFCYVVGAPVRFVADFLVHFGSGWVSVGRVGMGVAASVARAVLFFITIAWAGAVMELEIMVGGRERRLQRVLFCFVVASVACSVGFTCCWFWCPFRFWSAMFLWGEGRCTGGRERRVKMASYCRLLWGLFCCWAFGSLVADFVVRFALGWRLSCGEKRVGGDINEKPIRSA